MHGFWRRIEHLFEFKGIMFEYICSFLIFWRFLCCGSLLVEQASYGQFFGWFVVSHVGMGLQAFVALLMMTKVCFAVFWEEFHWIYSSRLICLEWNGLFRNAFGSNGLRVFWLGNSSLLLKWNQYTCLALLGVSFGQVALPSKKYYIRSPCKL